MDRVCGLAGGRQWPDLDLEVPCCAGSAMFGPERCTCWETVYDQPQTSPLRADLPAGVRPRMCVDCAYRPNSPERRGDPDAAADTEQLRELADGGQPFWCHQGMRRPIVYRHPSGARVEASELDYAPPMQQIDGRWVPFKADGTPADLCGGWAALRLKRIYAEHEDISEPGADAYREQPDAPEMDLRGRQSWH